MSTTLEGLLSRYEQEDGEFEYSISGGETFRARAPRDASKLLELEKKSTQIQRIASGASPPEWKPYLPVSPEIVRLAVYIEALVIEPELTLLDCLRMAKKCGTLIPEIAGPILQKLGANVAAEEEEQIEESKND